MRAASRVHVRLALFSVRSHPCSASRAIGSAIRSCTSSTSSTSPVVNGYSQSSNHGVRVAHMINAFRDHGHSIAQLDPLGIANCAPEDVPHDLILSTYGFTDAQLDEHVGLTGEDALAHQAGLTGFTLRSGSLTVRQLHQRLTEIYSGTMAIESVHCNPRHMQWLYERLETVQPASFAPEKRREMFSTLSRAHTFEATLASKYQSAKRFGIEGGEAIIVGLNEMLERACALGVSEVVMGMPHRGRLNVLANVMTKPVEAILYEFRGSAAGTLADQETLRKESDRVFSRLDKNCNGFLSREELHLGLRQLGIDATQEEAENAFSLHDQNDSGQLGADEFFALTLRLLGRNYSGDVKYHLGITQAREFANGRTISLSLLPNPSHLEAVNPLVVGLARAKQHRLGDQTRSDVLPLLLHGDAAFSAQGVVFETIGLSNLYGFTTGGALHVVLNNQIGFTTTPRESRSSRYCTDIAKAVGAPIFHVNGDDVDAVVRACQLAMEFRHKFGIDVVVDFVCYRRHGHQEADNPMFTQPQMYTTIKGHPSTLSVYSGRLQSDHVLSSEECIAIQRKHKSDLEEKQKLARSYVPQVDDWLVDHGAPVDQKINLDDGADARVNFRDSTSRISTGMDIESLRELAQALTSLPPDAIHPHRVVAALYKQRAKMLEQDSIDWAMAEQLAWASCLVSGVHVRLTGQDVERGTFSHRHAVVHDQATFGKTYVPLHHLSPTQAPFEICNSSLSEFAVLGFELGYSLDRQASLVMWEAQFGDFANTAQCIIDQFICSAEAKWQLQTGLVMLLPHGLEGGGPEHSSARLERFLQLCNDDEREVKESRLAQMKASNWRIVNVTTPANFFHVIRLQVARPFRKPLVVMSPKQLLRHKSIRSPVADFLPGTLFERVLIDEPLSGDTVNATRLIMCSGRVWLDLINLRDAHVHKASSIVLLRLEQVAPFPYDLVMKALERFPNAELVWVQEEPINAGAWAYVQPRVNVAAQQLASSKAEAEGKLEFESARVTRQVRYVGRPPSSAPATGLYELHKVELDEVLTQAILE